MMIRAALKACLGLMVASNRGAAAIVIGRPAQTALALSLVLVCVNLAAAQEWPRFRGPNGQGQSNTIFPATWSETQLGWKVALPGEGNSSPVVWNDRIYVTSADAGQGMRWLLCLKAADGSVAWQTKYPFKPFHVHETNNYAASTPAVDKDHVYCLWGTPEEYLVVAVNHAGREVWRRDLGPFVSRHGFGTSPMLLDDMVIVTNDQDGTSTLQALDRKTGKVRWQIPRKTLPEQNASYAVPCVYQPPSGPVELIVNSWAYGITGIDPHNGHTNWELQVFPRRPVGSPIIVGDLILGNCGEGGGNNAVAAVRPGSRGSAPEEVYKIDRSSAPYLPTLLAYKDMVFLWGEKGVVSCIDAASGKKHWLQRIQGKFFGSPVRAGDKVYCISEDGEVVAIAASATYELLGRTPLGETSRSTPAIADNHMYLRTVSHLVSVPAKTP